MVDFDVFMMYKKVFQYDVCRMFVDWAEGRCYDVTSCYGQHPLPPREQNDRCKNNILPQTSFASGKNQSAQNMSKCCVDNVPLSLFYDSVTEFIGKRKNKQVLIFFEYYDYY